MSAPARPTEGGAPSRGEDAAQRQDGGPASDTVAGELLAALEAFAALGPLPPVRALHLPPASLSGTKDAEFCALELADGSIGLSFVLLADTLQQLHAGAGGALAGADPLVLARAFTGAPDARRAIGFAAINALSRCLFDRAGYRPDFDVDSIGSLDPVAGDHVGMIGFFRPLVGRIVEAGARLTVAELNPEFAGDFDGYRVTLDASELSACNKVLSTSTVLLNDTLDAVLAHCRHAKHFVMVGPGAGCLPDPLFARGVTLLGGAWITDSAALVDRLRSGAKWSEATRKFAMRRDRYPGVATLLERSGRGDCCGAVPSRAAGADRQAQGNPDIR
jgi:uncharacterized protein (DUF4213/DUF364 family)